MTVQTTCPMCGIDIVMVLQDTKYMREGLEETRDLLPGVHCNDCGDFRRKRDGLLRDIGDRIAITRAAPPEKAAETEKRMHDQYQLLYVQLHGCWCKFLKIDYSIHGEIRDNFENAWRSGRFWGTYHAYVKCMHMLRDQAYQQQEQPA